jgi:hypothetical protein
MFNALCAYTWRCFFLLHSYLHLATSSKVAKHLHLPRRCYIQTTSLILCFSMFPSYDIPKSLSIILGLYSRPSPCNWRDTQHCFALIVVTFYFLLLLFPFKIFLLIILVTWHVSGTVKVCSCHVTWPYVCKRSPLSLYLKVTCNMITLVVTCPLTYLALMIISISNDN